MNVTYDLRTATPGLHSRPRGVSQSQVKEIQRGRLLAAAVDTVADGGYSRMTGARLIARAGVSRKTFYRGRLVHNLESYPPPLAGSGVVL
jgi:Bacterial regulatory proteins, tetR family